MSEDNPDDRPDTGDAPRKEKRRTPVEDPGPAGGRDAYEERPPSGRLYRLGKRILDKGDDVKDLASAFIETSDRAKTEMVRMVAREVRNYLDELKLKEDFISLASNHSLEVNMSFHLKPLHRKAEKVEPKTEPKVEAKAEKPPTELEKRKPDGE